MNIVGISGLAGSGKDTAADYLVAHHDFVKVSMADPLKRICRDVFAFTDEQLWGPSEKRNAADKRYLRGRHLDQDEWRDIYLSPRYALQQLGTEWGRDCYENVWVDYAIRVAKALLDPHNPDYRYSYSSQNGLRGNENARKYKGVVIPDVRFKNEIDALKAAGAKLYRITRETAGLEGAAGAHQSEKEQQEVPNSEFNAVISNNGSKQALYECLKKLVIA